MKFNKSLVKVISLSDPEWSPFFINYKALKKKIKEMGTCAPVTGTRPGTGTPADLLRNSHEVAFFRLMHAELQKTSEFFILMEQQMSLRMQRIKQGIAYVKDFVPIQDVEARNRIRRACVQFYKDLLLLENFAIINYTGYSKAAKKHDKNTGFDTRSRFMKNVVNRQPFTHYPRVLEMITEMEQIFTEMDTDRGSNPRDEEDERRAIEAIRIMREEASCWQQEEQGDLSSVDSADSVTSETPAPAAVGGEAHSMTAPHGGMGVHMDGARGWMAGGDDDALHVKRRRLSGPVLGVAGLPPQQALVL